MRAASQPSTSAVSTVPATTKSWDRWQNENGVTITNYDDMDIDSFKEAVDGVDEWYQNELESQGYEGAKDLIDTFTK